MRDPYENLDRVERDMMMDLTGEAKRVPPVGPTMPVEAPREVGRSTVHAGGRNGPTEQPAAVTAAMLRAVAPTVDPDLLDRMAKAAYCSMFHLRTDDERDHWWQDAREGVRAIYRKKMRAALAELRRMTEPVPTPTINDLNADQVSFYEQYMGDGT